MTDDAANWASRIAEELPGPDVRRLARAASGGPLAVRQLRARTPAPVLRDACDQLLTRITSEDPYITGLLTGAARAVERAGQHQAIDVVWTGPESGITTGRLTAATVTELIRQARRQILLVSYATRTEPAIHAALTEAASRGVEITLLAENPADNPAYTAQGTPFPGLPAARLRWPASKRPPGAALHAKIIVVDDRIALITSANLTSRGAHGSQPRMRHPHPRRTAAPRHPRSHHRTPRPRIPATISRPAMARPCSDSNHAGQYEHFFRIGRRPLRTVTRCGAWATARRERERGRGSANALAAVGRNGQRPESGAYRHRNGRR